MSLRTSFRAMMGRPTGQRRSRREAKPAMPERLEGRDVPAHLAFVGTPFVAVHLQYRSQPAISQTAPLQTNKEAHWQQNSITPGEGSTHAEYGQGPALNLGLSAGTSAFANNLPANASIATRSSNSYGDGGAQFLTVKIVPDGNEKIGQRVHINLRTRIHGSPNPGPGNAEHVVFRLRTPGGTADFIDFDHDLPQGVAGGTEGASLRDLGSRTTDEFDARIGDTFQVALSLKVASNTRNAMQSSIAMGPIFKFL